MEAQSQLGLRTLSSQLSGLEEGEGEWAIFVNEQSTS